MREAVQAHHGSFNNLPCVRFPIASRRGRSRLTYRTVARDFGCCTLPAENIAFWIAEIEREYPALQRGEQRIARQQLRQLQDELGIPDEFDRIETEQRYFAMLEAYAAMIEPDGFELSF